LVQSSNKRSNNIVQMKTTELIESFPEGDLATELAGICTTILDGKVVNVDGLPNTKMKEALESLFVACGLEKSEMEVDDIASENDLPIGFGIPESHAESSKAMLSVVVTICQSKPSKAICRPLKGPMLNPEAYNNDHRYDSISVQNNSSDDDEGPLPIGFAAKARAVTLSKEHIKASAARRAHELACAKQGIEIDPLSVGNVREEWMVVPGKFDLFSAIKSGQPMRSRTFEGKKKAETNNRDQPMDPNIEAEIRAVREAYEETRGPSLIDQHREARKQQQYNDTINSSSWQWNRDKDLDAGRRVDKDALGMILGGAGSDLKNKFQSGT
jgi:Protein of unknown function (DUF3752)